MTAADLVGSLGVTLLLAAFALNATGRMASSARMYQVLNLVGASLSAVASFLIGYLPFVVLEGTWALVALYALLRSTRHDAAGWPGSPGGARRGE